MGFAIFAPREQAFGVTFSTRYAEELGLNWREAYEATITELHPLVVRIPVAWDSVEPVDGEFYFDDIDWMMEFARENGVQVVLAIGLKIPRWPECRIPSWAADNEGEDLTRAVLDYEQRLVLRYREHPALVRWQVENEPLFWYGECPLPDLDRLAREVEIVKDLDAAHPVVLTSSGEQATWFELSSLADVVGVSLYRFSWNPALGPVVFPHAPWYYRLHAALIDMIAGDEVVITELQMEPWFEDGLGNVAGDHIPFAPSDFDEHLQFARETGISEIWLWGVEWWYHEKLEGDDGLWKRGQSLFAE
ncbi:MAG: beta-galactosidase [Candidatus Uhrbacteria bacterium]|nr:beta-galactosidase [Candidatus Uhrbacteria bacterium]